MALDPRLGPLAYAHYLFACQFFEQIASEEKPRRRDGDMARLAAIRNAPDYEAAFAEAEPLVSVIIPTYNRGRKILERTYPCLAAQDYQNLEIIIIGDQMDEENADLLRSIADPRVRFHNLKQRGRYPEQQGPRWYSAGIKPINFGLRIAKGRWIAHLDDDDEFYPNHISDLLQAARTEHREWAHSQILYLDDNGNAKSVIGDPTPDLGKISRISSIYHAGLKTFRYNPTCWRYFCPGDWDLWERFLAMEVTHVHVPQVTGIHHGNLNRIMELTAQAEEEGSKPPPDIARIGRNIAPVTADNLRKEEHKLQTFKQQKHYQEWAKRHTLQEIDAELMAERMLKRWTVQPRFLILMPCQAKELPLLHRTIESMQQQFYRNWCLIIISDAASPDPIFNQTEVLGWLQVESLDDEAVLVETINQVVQTVPSDWLTVLPTGTTFEPNWMITTGDYINLHPKWAAIYTDDDQIDTRGQRHSPRMKPDFNLDYLRSMDYVGSSCWFRTEHFLELKGFSAFPGALQYDFMLRLFDLCGRQVIGHLAEPLVHYLEDTPHPLAEHAARAALEDHLSRNRIAADIEPGYAPMTRHVVYRHQEQPFVSIIIPNRDNFGFLKPCVDSVFNKTDYQQFEVIVVDNESVDPDVLAYYEEMRQRHGARFSVVDYNHPFNFSAQCNLGVQAARGEYLLLLNNDTEIIQPAWLSRMMAFGQRPDVGIVGARLVYPEDGGIQHAGVIAGLGQLAGHPFQGASLDDPGYMNRLHVDQNFSAVTAACMLIRRSVYGEVGGMDAENLKALYNDIDLCFKANEAGYLTVWTPHVTVIHLEHKSLDEENQKFGMSSAITSRNIQSRDYMHSRWQGIIANDPAYNRNLTLAKGDFGIDPVLVADWDTNFHDRPRVLAFPPAGGVGEYRFYAPLKGLSHAARLQSTVVQTSSYHQTRHLFIPELNRLNPDTVMRQVNFEPQELELLKFERQVRPDILHVYMMDDLITEMPRANPNYRHIPRNARFRLRQLLAHADRLIVSTEPLVELAKDMVADVRLIPNCLRDDLWLHLSSQRRTTSRPRIGWAGAQQHGGDLAQIVDVVKETAEEVDWVFFGMCPEELRPYIKEFHNFEVGVEAYPAKLASLNLDLAVAPLEIHPFNEAKSNLRLLEYGILGLPVIATDILPYQTNGAPVKRVANETGAWLEAIRERVNDMDAAYREGDKLRNWVRSHYLISQNLDIWYSALTRN